MTKSFTIDHTKLQRGIYLNDIIKTGLEDILTFDFRIYAPFENTYLTIEEIHSIEHLLASYMNDRVECNKIAIYPYGCQTGFGITVFGNITVEDIKNFILDLALKVINGTISSIPGNSVLECGNPKTLNLQSAKKVFEIVYSDIINNKYSYKY
jgi:S-ribosylhomocysteine lyase